MAKSDYIYTDPTTYTIGNTPYALYDDDNTFKTDAVNVTKWVAKRLGHPVMQLEFNSGSIYATFEESISEYSTHINNYNIKNWMWNSYGSEARESGSVYSETGTSEPQNPNGMGTNFFLSEQYGAAAGVGGDMDLHTGSITLENKKQVYDLQTEATVVSDHSGSRLEIQRVFNYGPNAITRFYDPFAGSFDQRSMLDSFGFGNVAPAVSFILRPISYDIARAQGIETNDKVRKSAYSFELVNNKLRIFPRPKSSDDGEKLYFNYYLRNDMNITTNSYTKNKVTDPSNVPYKFIRYENINSSGRQWIRKFTLALSKELLGIIRSKYASMPLPNGEVTMDGEGLKAEGREEKTQLLEELKEFLDSVSLTEKTKAEAEEAEANQQVLNKSPLGIWIG
jgi:hypothetical protein